MLNAPFFLLQDVDTMVSLSKKWKMCLSVKCSLLLLHDVDTMVSLSKKWKMCLRVKCFLLFVTRCGHYGLFVKDVEDVS